MSHDVGLHDARPHETQAAPVGGRFFTPGTLVLVALALLGGCFVVARFVLGLGAVSNLDQQHPWGIWIGVDVASGVALAAGGFMTAALGLVLRIDAFKPAVRPALLTAWLGYTFVSFGLLVDLGRYYNIWHPIIYWQGNSVLFEVGMCVMFYSTVLTVEFSEVLIDGLLHHAGGRWKALLERLRPVLLTIRKWQHRLMPAFVIAGITLSCLHQSSLGSLMLIAPYKLSALWYTPIQPLLFLLSAMSVGLAMVTVETRLAERVFRLPPEVRLLRALRRALPWPLAIYAILKIGDFIYRGAYVHLDGISSQTVAFVVEVGLGVLLPLLLLLLPGARRSLTTAFAAALLVVGGVVLNRVNVFLIGYRPPYAEVTYFPAFAELAITAGLISTLVLVYRFCVIYLPVLPTEHASPSGRQPSRGTGSREMVTATAGLALLIVVPAVRAAEPAHDTESDGFFMDRAPDLLLIDHDELNADRDAYHPVRFMHRAHATSLGDCTACHHRSPLSPADRTGVPVTSGDLQQGRPAACDHCHNDALSYEEVYRPGLRGALHQSCMGCHTRTNTGPVGCKECHRARVPDHASLVRLAANPTPQQVTQECLRCHEQDGLEVMASVHFRWHGASPDTLNARHRTDLGKSKLLNNFCIATESNWPRCTMCHVGYGWKDETFDFDVPANVDCLVCHDTTGTYRKSKTNAGMPEKGVDLVHVSQSVGHPTRGNCGFCHFFGGGGNNVKHGDLCSALTDPSDTHDVHMGKYDMTCQDCHGTRDHRIAGGSLAIPAREGRVTCEQCHGHLPHVRNRLLARHLNDHVADVACQACHVPTFAKANPTKMHWDWSDAGKDLPVENDAFGKPTFAKIKGSFEWGKNVRPDFAWYNGKHTRHEAGDRLADSGMTWLNEPTGHINDPSARIYPFKIHTARQPADAVHRHLVIPHLFGGFWKHFDWAKAAETGMAAAGLDYSGRLEFADTAMYWAINHEVAPASHALTCVQCHTQPTSVSCSRCHQDRPVETLEDMTALHERMSAEGRPACRIDFDRLGYGGDPALVGGRDVPRSRQARP